MLSSGYYAWDVRAAIPQSSIHHVKNDVSQSVDVQGEATEMTPAPYHEISETTGTIEKMAKIFDAAHYCY